MAGPGGVVYAGTAEYVGTPILRGQVYRSVDRGRTWEHFSGPETGWGGWRVSSLLVGRDGRLYAATDGGVWATRDPLPVASAPLPPPDGSPLGLLVRPNPTAGRTEVVVTLSAPVVRARVVVVDALGRTVSIVYDGALTAGATVLGVDAAGWAAGIYVVRAEADGRVVTARLAITR